MIPAASSSPSAASASASPGVSILIPTHNRAAILARTLESLAQIALPPSTSVELIIIANACTDDTKAVVAAHAARLPFPVRCFAEPTPGLSVARNRAVAEAKHDLLIFLDDDVQLDPRWLLAHLALFDEHGADVTTGRIDLWFEEAPDPGWLSPGMKTVLGHFDLGPGVFPPPQHEIRGGNFGFRRAVFAQAGPFSTALGRTGAAGLLAGEEALFSQRAAAAGFSCLYSNAAAIRHWVPAKRLDPAYLARASAGSVYSIERLREQVSAMSVLRSLVGGCVRVIGHTLVMAISALSGNAPRRITSLVQRSVGWAQLRGVIDRVRLGPITRT